MNEERARFKPRGVRPRNVTMEERMGPAYSCAKLTDLQVLEIRRRYARGGVTQAAVAREFHVERSTVSKIVNGSRWKAV